MNYINGEVLVIDKPLRWTSFDVVKRIRGAIQRRMGLKRFKVGHAGTLDPLATGVLIVCTGRATRRIEALQSGLKEYVAEITFGATTPSYDLEKEIDAHYPWAHITEEMIREILPRFTGKVLQVPPVFSAVKVDGRRAYKYARSGEAVEIKPKELEIPELELLGWDAPKLRLRIVCSKGTYIRALARDFGEALQSGAHLTALRRTRVGDCTLNDAMSVEEAVEMIATAPVEYPDDGNAAAAEKE